MLYRKSASIPRGNEQENPPSNSAVDPVQALADGLQGHSALEVLWLRENRIGDAGLQALGGGAHARCFPLSAGQVQQSDSLGLCSIR